MDREQAKFVLESFRPDGADAQDPEFADALAMATEDRELGEWLAHERAQDAAFAAALNGIEIPEDLRESIMQVLAGTSSEDFTQMDAAFVGALASVRAPDGLRDQIVAAMRMQESGAQPRRARNWFRPLSIAAAIALGAFLAFQVTAGDKMSLAAVEREAIDVLNASFTLDRKNPDHDQLFAYLDQKHVPVPETLPDGLEEAPTLGCKILKLDGHTASLVCFQLKGSGVLHLVVMDLDEVRAGEFGSIAEAKKNCRHCPVSGWSRASWNDGERFFLLLGKMQPDAIAEAF